jgi:hypothetical protein
MFWTGFTNMQITDAIEIPIFDGGLPAFEGVIRFLGDDVLHHILPGPGREFRISRVQINPRQTEIDVRLAFSLVCGIDLLDCQRCWLAPCLVSVRLSIACCHILVATLLSEPIKYALAICRFKMGCRNDSFLALRRTLASASSLVRRLSCLAKPRLSQLLIYPSISQSHGFICFALPSGSCFGMSRAAQKYILRCNMTPNMTPEKMERPPELN